MSVIRINKDNFQNEVINSSKPVLLDFYANWCGPCRMVSPIVDEIAEEREDIKVGKINVDEEGELAEMFLVYSAFLLTAIWPHLSTRKCAKTVLPLCLADLWKVLPIPRKVLI